MTELINGRTPEEIKTDIARCGSINGCAGCRNIGNRECVEMNMIDALALIEHLEAKVPKWISVEERLPERPGEVLMVLFGRVCVGWYHIDGQFESGSGMVWGSPDSVTHWMPLPEPPKEGTK